MDHLRINIDPQRCQLCGQCVEACSRNNIELGPEAAMIKSPERCSLCGHCKSVCPENAPQLQALNPKEFEPSPALDQMPAPDDFLAFLRSRRSIRSYKAIPVPKTELEMMVQAGRFAPTGGNRQPVRYVILQTPEVMDTVRKMTHGYLAAEAEKIAAAAENCKITGKPLPPRASVRLGYVPLWRAMGKMYERGKDLLFHFAPSVVVLHADPEFSSPFCADVGLAAMQMVLMAETLGLGTCFCGFLTVAANRSRELKQTLQIPSQNNVVLSFMVGYPNVEYLRLVSRNSAQVTFL